MASLVVPITGALLISRLDKTPNVREAVTLITAVSLFAINIYYTLI
jgi:multicomponent Na+:H+ antiporter subunit D